MQVIKKMKKIRRSRPLFKSPQGYYESIGIKVQPVSDFFCNINGEDMPGTLISFLPDFELESEFKTCQTCGSISEYPKKLPWTIHKLFTNSED